MRAARSSHASPKNNIFFPSLIFPQKGSGRQHRARMKPSRFSGFPSSTFPALKPHGTDALLGGAEHPKPNCSYKGQTQTTQKINSFTSLHVKLEPDTVTSGISCVYRDGGVSGTTGSDWRSERPAGQGLRLTALQKTSKIHRKIPGSTVFFLSTLLRRRKVRCFLLHASSSTVSSSSSEQQGSELEAQFL